MKKEKYLKYIFILFPIIILMIISFLNMQNAKLISTQYTNHFTRQIIWYAVGFGIIGIFLLINPSLLFKYSLFLYAINVILLILVLFIGKEINGARAWFNFGFFSYQPSETMKFTLLLYLIHLSSKFQKIPTFKNELKLISIILLATFIPSFLTFLEPDTGAVIIYLIIALIILLLSHIRKRWFIILFLITTILLGAFFAFFYFQKDAFINIFGTSFFYRIDRLIDFKNGSGMQLENALTAIGVSKTFGNGINNFTLYFPEAPTDFIFALTLTNFGFTGGLIVLITCFALNINLLIIVFKNKNEKIRQISLVIFAILAFQQLQNILMNIGLSPIIGIPLPFLSYGGTNLIVLFCLIALLIKMLIIKEKYPLRVL